MTSRLECGWSWSAGVLVLALVLILKVGPYAGLLVMAVSAALPFTVSGLILSRLFRAAPGLTGSLYAADMAGAAAGALIVPIMLSDLGPVQAILALAAMLAAIGTLLTLTHFRLVQTVPGPVCHGCRSPLWESRKRSAGRRAVW